MNKLFVILFFPLLGSAQPAFFEKIWGTGGADQARSVKQLSDGNIYVAGFSDSGTFGGIDISLSKIDESGNLLWIKYYGDGADNFGLYLNKTNDGNLIITGERQSFNGTQVDAFAYKIDTAGIVLWNKIYATPLNESFKYVEQTFDNGYIFCGFRNDAFGYNDTYVMKTNSVGDSSWSVMVGGTDNDYSDAVHQLPDSTYLVTGDTRSIGMGNYDVELTHLDSTGQQLWDLPYGDQWANGCQGVFLNSSGNYLSFGETVIFNNSPFDFYLEEIDTSGTSLWRQTFGGANADAIFSIIETSDKGYLFTGYSNSYSSGPLDLVVARTDSDGIMQWIRTYGGTGIDIGYEILHARDNGVIIAGTTNDSVTFDSQYYLLHLDEAGLLTEIKEVDHENDLSVWPNPNNGSFNIHCENFGGQAELNIYSTDGKLVQHNSLIAKNSRISLSENLPQGVYFTEVRNGKRTKHCRIVVIRAPF